MNIGTETKEQGSTAIFAIDWSPWLGTRTISSSVWTVPVGLTNEDEDNTTTTTTIELSGGVWGEEFEVDNTVTLNTGEVETRSITIKIQQEQQYCSATEVRRRAAIGTATTNALSDAELEALIEQASRMFDLECGVPEGYFNPPAYPIATNQIVYGDGTNYLRLPPYVPGTLNTTLTLPDGYTAPIFAEREGFLVLSTSTGVLPPFSHWLGSYWAGWHTGVAVTVSAIWGFKQTPPDVKKAVIDLVLHLWRTTDRAQVKITNIENQQRVTEAMPESTREIAHKYRFKTGAVFV